MACFIRNEYYESLVLSFSLRVLTSTNVLPTQFLTPILTNLSCLLTHLPIYPHLEEISCCLLAHHLSRYDSVLHCVVCPAKNQFQNSLIEKQRCERHQVGQFVFEYDYHAELRRRAHSGGAARGAHSQDQRGAPPRESDSVGHRTRRILLVPLTIIKAVQKLKRELNTILNWSNIEQPWKWTFQNANVVNSIHCNYWRNIQYINGTPMVH